MHRADGRRGRGVAVGGQRRQAASRDGGEFEPPRGRRGGTRLVAHLCGVRALVIATPVRVWGCTRRDRPGGRPVGPVRRAVLHGAPRGCLGVPYRLFAKSAKIARRQNRCWFQPPRRRARGSSLEAAPRRARAVRVAMTKFSVIVPTYNERRNIGILYLLLREAFAHRRRRRTNSRWSWRTTTPPTAPRTSSARCRRNTATSASSSAPPRGRFTRARHRLHPRSRSRHGRFRRHHGRRPGPPPSRHTRVHRQAARHGARGCHRHPITSPGSGGDPRMGHATKTHIPRRQLPRARPAQPRGVSDLTESPSRLYRKDALERMVRSV